MRCLNERARNRGFCSLALQGPSLIGCETCSLMTENRFHDEEYLVVIERTMKESEITGSSICHILYYDYPMSLVQLAEACGIGCMS